MNPAALTALIGIDWGTSSLRAVCLDAAGRVHAERRGDEGITRVADGAFEQTLEVVLADWNVPSDVPVVLSGMITSRNGWLETPYLPVPAALPALASAMRMQRAASGRALAFVPGVNQGVDRAGQPTGLPADVMRGEETELLGWLDAAGSKPQAGTTLRFVLPGTHSKWAELRDGSIVAFSTCMTGEIFEALCRHTILGRLMTGDAVADDAFDDGARIGLREPARLLAHCFSARALPLLERMPVQHTRDYLAGLLIGAEVAGQLAGATDGPLIIIGRGDLAERYARVLSLAGRHADVAEPGSAARGQFALARLAGLV